MTVEFYILDTAHKQQAWLFACGLVDKAHAENQQVFIHTASPQDSEKIDQLLWTFKDDSFIPHEILNSETKTPIVISDKEPPDDFSGTLLNFNHALPVFHQQFDRVIEIVYSEPTIQQQARERYKYYRDANLELITHKLKANEL